MCRNIIAFYAILARAFANKGQPGDEAEFEVLTREIQTQAANLAIQKEEDSQMWRLAWSTIRLVDAWSQLLVPKDRTTLEVARDCEAVGVSFANVKVPTL
jgi:hypothetical protein